MKKIVFLLITIIFLNGCGKNDKDSQNLGEIIKFKTLSINIELPNNSSILESDLTISSLFSDNTISNGASEIESFEDNSMELTFATNQQGNIVMLSYFNPSNNETIQMNSETTAVSLIMMHPWTFDLSVNAKEEAIEFIKNLPEFEPFKSEIESSIINGELNPLNTQNVLEKVIDIQRITFNRTTEFIEPLEFNIQNSTASVKNVLSSATYSIGLYDENDILVDYKPAKGLSKSHFLFQEFKNNIFQESISDQQTATFSIPSDGNWTLKAKSGLSFDSSSENLQAAYYNTRTIVGNVLGIFSQKLKTLVENRKCLISIGERVYNDTSSSIDISSSIQSYSNGSLSGYELTKDVLSYSWNKFDSLLNIIDSCSNENTEQYGLDKIKSGVFGKILDFLDALNKLENVFNSTAMLTDWIQYDKEIEFCFNKNGTQIQECTIDLSGVWNIEFTNSTCNGSGKITFNNDGSINFINPAGLNNDVLSSSYSLNGNTLTINHNRSYDLCEAPPGSGDNVDITDNISIQVEFTNQNNFTGTFSNIFSGDGLATCNAQNPSCSGKVIISK